MVIGKKLELASRRTNASTGYITARRYQRQKGFRHPSQKRIKQDKTRADNDRVRDEVGRSTPGMDDSPGKSPLHRGMG